MLIPYLDLSHTTHCLSYANELEGGNEAIKENIMQTRVEKNDHSDDVCVWAEGRWKIIKKNHSFSYNNEV